MEVWGAQGQNYGGKKPGYGGYSVGNIYAATASAIYIIVGRQGSTSYAYNGGPNGKDVSDDRYISYAGGGGGATHISTYNCGELKNCFSYKSNILIVAGGGGGAGFLKDFETDAAGGDGGGINGGSGYGESSYAVGLGGDQNNGGGRSAGASAICSDDGFSGLFGFGGQCITESALHSGSSGGGGWYGGGAGSNWGKGGGGGSGYIGNSLLLGTKRMYCYTGNSTTACGTSTATATYTVGTSSTGHAVANAANTGNGYAKITYLGT